MLKSPAYNMDSQCPYCKRYFKNVRGLEVHLRSCPENTSKKARSTKKTSQKTSRCPHCAKNFDTHRGVKIHMRTCPKNPMNKDTRLVKWVKGMKDKREKFQKKFFSSFSKKKKSSK